MNNAVIWIWCFPQMLVGLILQKITKARKVGDVYHYNLKCGSVSLGKYIFLCPAHYNDEEAIRHEKGHTIQSLYLGFLYIPIVLIPSLIWCGCFEKYRQKHNVSYYSFYTEKWANKLAGIE